MSHLKNPMVLFFLVAFGGPWLGWSSIHILGMTEPSALRTALFYTGNFCSVGGFVALYAKGGKAGLIDLLKRCVRFNVPLTWWGIALFVPFLITFIAYLLTGMSGNGIGLIDPAGLWVYLTPAVLMNFTTGPLGEEAGWRGYLVPELLKKNNAIVVSLIVGFLWGIWHIPLYIDSVFSTFSGGLIFTINTMLTTVIMTAILLHTRGSILVAVIYHWLINATPQVVGRMFVDVERSDDLQLISIGVEAVVMFIFIAVLGKNLKRDRPS